MTILYVIDTLFFVAYCWSVKCKNQIPIVILSLLISLSLFSVKAVSPNASPKAGTNPNKPTSVEGKIQQKMEEKEQAKEEKRMQHCEKVQARVRARIMNFEQYKSNHVERYNRVRDRLQIIVQKMNGYGLDTADLSTYATEFSSMVDAYAVEYTEFIETLDTAEEYDCAQSPDAFKGALQLARQSFADVKTQRAEIRKYYKDYIRSELQSLRQQYGTQNSGEEE